MRRGEAASLRWSALDRDDLLSVRSGAVDTRGGVVEKLPTTAQRRELLIDDTTAAQWRQRQATVRDSLRAHELPFAPTLHVFSIDPTRTAPMRPDPISKKWVVTSRRAEVTPGVELRSLRN
jgi:integrase